MKASAAAADKYLASKADLMALTLVFSSDTARARSALQTKIKAALGDKANEELRLQVFEYKDIAKDFASLSDAIRSASFFPGPRGVVVYHCTDAAAKFLIDIMDERSDDDAHLFVQAGNLTKASKLRKAFEAHKSAMVIGLYDDPITPIVAHQIAESKKLRMNNEALVLFADFAYQFDKATIERLAEGLAMWQGDDVEINAEVLAGLLPGGQAAAMDDLINYIFNGDAKSLVTHLRRAPGQGISNHFILAMAIRRCVTLLTLKSSGDPFAAIGRLRPPVFGPRRAQLEAQLRKWTSHGLEAALQTLSDTELQLRSGQKHVPEMATVERNLLRVTFLNRSR